MIADRVPIVRLYPPETDSIELYLISDLHYGSQQFDEKRWQVIKKQILEKDNRYVIFAGDLMDMALKNSKSNVYQATCTPHEQKLWVAGELSDLSSRTVCVIPGNHEGRPSRDSDLYPLYDACLMAGIQDRYRQTYAFVDISLGTAQGGDYRGKPRQQKYIGYVVHKACRTVRYHSADTIDGIDFFVYGHTHDPLDLPKGRLCYDRQAKRVYERSVEVVNAGSFHEYGGYAAEGGYRPTSQKIYKLVLMGKEHQIQTVGYYA